MRDRALVFDQLYDAVIVTTPEGIITDWNAGAERMYCWAREEVLGLTPALFHRPDDALVLIDTINAAVVSEGRWTGEVPFVRKDGSVGVCESVAVAVRDEDGRLYSTVSVNREITVRKYEEEALITERSLLRILIDAIPDPIFVKDREGRHLIMNEANRVLFNITDEEHLGKTIFEWPVSREHALLYAADDEAVMATGQAIINREEPYSTPNGRTGWFLTSKFPLHDPSGRVNGLVGIARDITAMKQQADEMAHMRRRLVDHVDNSPLAVVEWTADRRIQHWAGQAERIFEWTAEEVMGKTAEELNLVHPDDQASVETIASQLYVEGVDRNVSRNRNITKSGRVVHCVWNNSMLRDSTGKAVSVLSLAADVTERIMAEKAAQEAEAARAGLERKLLETQKLESLGVLAGGIAHDFNNLLTGVLGHASLLLEDTPTSSPLHGHAEQIETIAVRAADLCRQMLAYSGRGRFVVQKLDLNHVVEETAKLLHVSVSKKAAMEFHLVQPLPAVLGDATQLRQIVMNLVINASEAIGDHEGRIELKTGLVHADKEYFSHAVLAPELPEGDYVFLEVADTGGGMTPEVKARIFDPFFTTKFTGRGLGLAAVLGIVRGHGGALRVSSQPGVGTIFRALFPPVQGTGQGTDDSGAKEVAALKAGGKVLVVDDEDIVRRVTARLLHALGFEIVLASDGREAVATFERNPGDFTLVMLDLTMPRMDGRETFHELRKRKPDVRVLLMSGFDEADAMARFAGMGLAGFIQKPFKLANVKAKLAEVLVSEAGMSPEI